MYSTIVRLKQLVIYEPVIDCCWKIDQIDRSSLKSADGRRWPGKLFLEKNSSLFKLAEPVLTAVGKLIKLS